MSNHTPHYSFIFGIVLVFALTSQGCDDNDGPPGHLVVRNDILDEKFNKITIDNIVAKSGLVGYRATLKPGDRVVIPNKGVTSIRFTRKYESYSRVYVVKCPENPQESVTLKLIDVHTGRLNGGCTLTKKGRLENGVTKWEEQ